MSYNSTCLLNNPKGDNLNKLLDFYGLSIDMDPALLFATHYQHLDVQNLRADADFKIPPISHHMWLTNVVKPKEVRDSDIENLKNTISIIDNSSNTQWQHIFWTNCNSCIPQTSQKLKPLNVIMRNIDEIKEQLPTYEVVTKLVYEKKFGMAVDLLREDLVNLFGGFYTDLNYVLNSSPESLMKKVNFIADAPVFIGIENYMFASSINHPILTYAIKSTLGLINNPNILGIDLSGCDNEDLTHSLSFGPFASAFLKNANKYGTIDLAIPSRETEMDNDSIKETHMVNNLDGTITTTYVYHECPLEQKEELDFKSAISMHLEYNKNHIQCTNIKIGEDGKDGGTWQYDFEMRASIPNDYTILVEQSITADNSMLQ